MDETPNWGLQLAGEIGRKAWMWGHKEGIQRTLCLGSLSFPGQQNGPKGEVCSPSLLVFK